MFVSALRPSGGTPSASNVAAAQRSAPQQTSALTRISDPSTVCMVNDQHMGRAQIPVQVEGRTYYGCCQACEARLKNDVAIRTATDPETHRPIDKAVAVLAMDGEGKVLYFESAQSLESYQAHL